MRRLSLRSAWLPVALTALAAALRFWALDRIPPGFHYDEAFEALEAWRVWTQPGYHPIFFPGNFGVEPIFIYLTSLAFRILGPTPQVMRGVAAVLGTLTVPALYGLGRELLRYEPRLPAGLPALAALALATMRWHVLFSRVGIEPVLVPLLLVIMLWALFRGLRTGGLVAWALAGVAAGLGPYAYPAGRLLAPLAVVLVLLVGWLDRRRLAGRGSGLLVAALACLATVAPLAWHFARHPDLLLLRSSQIAVSSAEGQSNTFLGNLLATLGMFTFRGDADPRNNVPGLPALDPWLAVAFLFGLAIALWRWRRPAYSATLLAMAAMLAPTVLSEYAPHFRRALGATPAVALLGGLGLATVLAQAACPPAGLREPGRRRLALAWQTACVLLPALLLTGSAVTGARDYFVRWGNSADLFYAYDEGLWQIGAYVKSLPPGEHIYVSPRPETDRTLAFAWREGPEVRHFDGRHAFVAPAYLPQAGGAATYVIVEHEDPRGAGLLRELYPTARETRQFLDRRGKVYARAFEVPAAGQTLRRPSHPSQAAWPGIELLGYDLDRETFRPGDTIYLQLWWRATAPIASDWTVFTHLLGPAQAGPASGTTRLWSGQDARPGAGSAPTSAWQPGDLVLDEYLIRVPGDAPAGSYTLEVGLYDPAAGGARAVSTTPADQDHTILGQVTVQ